MNEAVDCHGGKTSGGTQKLVSITFPVDGTIFDFIGADSAEKSTVLIVSWCPACSDRMQVSSTVTKGMTKSLELRLILTRHLPETTTRFRFCLSVSITPKALSYPTFRVGCGKCVLIRCLLFLLSHST